MLHSVCTIIYRVNNTAQIIIIDNNALTNYTMYMKDTTFVEIQNRIREFISDDTIQWRSPQMINNRAFNSAFPRNEYTARGYCALITMLFMDLLHRKNV